MSHVYLIAQKEVKIKPSLENPIINIQWKLQVYTIICFWVNIEKPKSVKSIPFCLKISVFPGFFEEYNAFM